MTSSSSRLPASTDTRLLLAGLGAFLALVAYLAVAFVNTHVTAFTSPESPVAPWIPSGSKLIPVPQRGGGYAVQVIPLKRGTAPGNYGALVDTLVPDPRSGSKYVVGLWLRGSPPGRIGVELNEFRPGVARYPLQTTVPATADWHHFTFSARVHGTWLGLAAYVYRQTNVHPARTRFALRGLTVKRVRR